MSCPVLGECRSFLEEITSNSDEDNWYIKVGSYQLETFELVGEVTNWTLQFLEERKCPALLTAPIVRNVVESVQSECRKAPNACGLDTSRGSFDPSALKEMVVASLKNFCQRLMDNVELNKILPSRVEQRAYPKYVVASVRNKRRKMEDRYICIDDFNATYNILDNQKASFYAVFDGHNGHNAAVYTASQLPIFLANHPLYHKYPAEALKQAFNLTDDAFIEKCKKQKIHGGTTAVCALHFPQKEVLYVAWVGDSKALLVKNGRYQPIVTPHKPTCPDERQRIAKLGGTISDWDGIPRVNGVLDVSRAIGDINCKPCVTSDPDIRCLALDNEEDFLVIGCDGLWDYVTDEDVAHTVYTQLHADCENLNAIPQSLIEKSKLNESSDNITVIVVFLKHPCLIVKNSRSLEAMETTFDNCNNADLNNPVQNLLQNANTEFKTDKSNDLFKTDNPFNDGMNNFVQIGNDNLLTTSSTKLDSADIIGMQQEDLPECEQMYNFGDEGRDSKLNEKRTFEDMGPETSVDVPDDVIMNTESSEENLSKSSLSHSKDAFPLSDNLNPFDVKNSLTDLDANDFQMQDDTKTCTTPSENLLDTPVDPSSLDDAKQMPADSVHTNGIHSEDDHLAEDLLAHDQLPIASESKDIKNEENHLNELDQDLHADGGFVNDFVEEYKINQHSVNEPAPAFEEHYFGQVQEAHIDVECSQAELEKKHHETNELDFNSHLAEGDKFVEEDLEHEEAKGLEKANDALIEEEIHDLKPTSPMMQDFDEELQQNELARQEQMTPTEMQVEKCDEEFDNGLDQKLPLPLEVEKSDQHTDSQTNDFEKQFQIDETFNHEQKKFGLDLDNIERSLNKVSEDTTLPLDEEFCCQMKELDDAISSMPASEESVEEEVVEIHIHGISPEEAIGIAEKSSQVLEDIKENLENDDDQDEIELQKLELKDLQAGLIEMGQELLTGITEEVKEMLIGDEVEEVQEIEKAQECFQQPASLEMDTKPVTPSAEEICQPTAPESCDESEDEWNYMRLKGEGEKEIPKSCETEELVSPVEQEKDIIPEELPELPSEDSQPAAELEPSQEAPVATANESKDTTSTQSVEPSVNELELTGTHLNLDKDEEALADMASQLNPEAKEFIPTNMSPVHFDLSNGIPPVAATRHIASDDVVAQSPRKGLFSMDDVQVPSQKEFNNEIAHCPSEVETSPEPNALYQEMNLKEAMHGSEKEEQVCEDNFGYNTDLDNVGMKDSIYIENSFGKETDVMNTIQPVPADDEICNLSKEMLDESIADTTGSSSFVLEESSNIETQFKPLSPAPPDLVAEITQHVEGMGIVDDKQSIAPTEEVFLAKTLEATSVEPELVASVPPVVRTEVLEPAIPAIPVAEATGRSNFGSEEFRNIETEFKPSNPAAEITQHVEQIGIFDTKRELAPIEEISKTAGIFDTKQELAPIEEVSKTAPVDAFKLMNLFEVESIKEVASVEPAPAVVPTQPTEIKKEKEVIEKVVTEKIETVKAPVKVPETKKDIKPRVSSATGPKKIGSTTSTTSADSTKPKTSQAATKSKTSTTTTAAPRPRTVPLASKPPIEKKAATSTTLARSKIDAKSPSSVTAKKPALAAPKTKPDEQKVGVKQSVSKTGVTARPPVTSRTSSTTSTASKTRTSATASTTGVTTTKTTTTQRVALSATAKSASTTKPLSSPRSTLTSTLRKTEAIKSPTGPAKLSATKTTTTTTTPRTSSTTKSKPATPGSKASSTGTTTTTTTSTAAKKLPLTSSTRLSTATQKKSPIKKTAITPVKKPAADESKNKEANEIKLNGTTIEAVALDSKTAELVQ